MEDFESGIVSAGAHGGHVEHVTDRQTSAIDAAVSFELSAVEVIRRKSDEGGDLLAAHLSEFRQQGDGGEGERGADAPHRGQQFIASRAIQIAETSVFPLWKGLFKELRRFGCVKGLAHVNRLFDRTAAINPILKRAHIINLVVSHILEHFAGERGAPTGSAVENDDLLPGEILVVVGRVGVGAVSRAPIGIIRTIPETRALLQQCMEEVSAVACASRIQLSDSVVSDRMSYVDTLPANSTTSLQRDIADGKPSEIDYWTGSVVRQGSAVNVSTPLNQFIYHSLLPQELRARGNVVFPQ